MYETNEYEVKMHIKKTKLLFILTHNVKINKKRRS